VTAQQQLSQRFGEQRKFLVKSLQKKPVHSIAFLGLPKYSWKDGIKIITGQG